MGDIHGSPEYRANLVAVMARRAVENLGKLRSTADRAEACALQLRHART